MTARQRSWLTTVANGPGHDDSLSSANSDDGDFDGAIDATEKCRGKLVAQQRRDGRLARQPERVSSTEQETSTARTSARSAWAV
jgi:hypothetical protein